MDKVTKFAQIILSELQQFENLEIAEYQSPIYTPEASKATELVHKNKLQMREEPFLSCVRVQEKLDSVEEWTERIYLVTRNFSPSDILPVIPNGMFVNLETPVGKVAEKKIDAEYTIMIGPKHRRVPKTFVVLEKNTFTPKKNQDKQFDGIDNHYFDADRNAYFQSLQELLAEIAEEFEPEEIIILPEPGTDGQGLLDSINDAERSERDKRARQSLKKQKRRKAIVGSMALKDNPILDDAQGDFARLPLASRFVLAGSPGTGKTTTLIRRLSFKSSAIHLQTTEDISLDSDRRVSWQMFTPNHLLRSYLKEAMNKAGLAAPDEQVTLWKDHRTVLGRRLKITTGDGGIFVKNSKEFYKDGSGAALIERALEFIGYFNDMALNDFFEAVELLTTNRPQADIISKENSGLTQDFNRFAAECWEIKTRIENRRLSDSDARTLLLIELFQPLKPLLAKLRGGLTALISKTIDDLIVKNPQMIEAVAEFIVETSQITESPEDAEDLPEEDEIEAIEDLTDDADAQPEEEEAEAEADLRVAARRLIRQTFARYAESVAGGRPFKIKRQVKIWELVGSHFTDLNLTEFIGKLGIPLPRRIFGHLDHERILLLIPMFYQQYRRQLVKSGRADEIFVEKTAEHIKNKRISLAELDVLIYFILRLAEKIFGDNKALLRETTKADFLEEIKEFYRTQIAVDEAADFSPVQLGAIYHLAHPEFKSVSFAGDLMQRATRYGITDWEQIKFISERLDVYELDISYRQTPVLLNVAAKLFENVVGSKPPFRTNYEDSEFNPPPLRFHSDSEDGLGDWVTGRILEIYKACGMLPSIEIFVPEESDIDRAYDIISDKLNEFSIDIDKCPGGVLGSGSQVRIFSIEYIKGLEFEGVFLLNIDEIEKKQPDLLIQYLYVGLTRATTYLSATYETEFPESIGFIEEDFKEGTWQLYER